MGTFHSRFLGIFNLFLWKTLRVHFDFLQMNLMLHGEGAIMGLKTENLVNLN
jgi:hypothetical protein